ncbi:predicted protein [Sclerotinia sclerotiorum 1980 UF-70]|uniref:Uncharacterized protein n=2 Tax=Sclerotinia sclerotiorum (strain ATCC 18683 / 1980 / Ss-1) TaxID=665079 RepID=A0A1D9QF73_SCLS1|nr:predicted protein [Sclerotinia sclerotiorum 1980 UF-70]APA13585.1 hypothetical protein sscle_11g083550 [Sclerotinia sclerotiorum 1980 UF-70]EDN91903.1 predicted protein [Sclerotinia sclerotiorum 1980 UF-70]
MVQNFILYDCGHRELESPSPLKRLKRALSLKRVLSNKVREPKDIRVDGACLECRKYPIGLLIGDQVFRRVNNPMEPAVIREENTPSDSSDEPKAESQQERSSSEEEAAHEEDVEEREGLDHGVVERPPTRIPRRPVGAPLAQEHPKSAESSSGEDPFADGEDPFKEGEHAFTDGYLHEGINRWISLTEKEREHDKGALGADESTIISDEQEKE